MRRLLVFLKDPVPGNVKTRLAASIGAEGAAMVYRTGTEVLLERLSALQSEAVLYVDPPAALVNVRAWLGSEWTFRAQRGADLGERLSHAIGEAFAEGAKRVVVIGTDSPWLTPEDLEAAFEALRGAEVVVGPTDDGGYYLVGLSRPAPALFEGIAWSSERVCAQTTRRARELSLRLVMLPRGYDIDYLDDVQRWLEDERRRLGCRS